jgi:alpha-N-arabinofuranosidase
MKITDLKTLVWLLTFVALSVAVSRLAVAQDTAPAANLLPNPSFEEDEADGVRGWKPRAWQGEEDGRWNTVSPGRTGKQCLCIYSEQGTDAAWSTTVTAEPNCFYRLSGWIKTKDLKGAVGALLNIQNMQHVRTTRVKGTSDWTRVSTVFRTDETTELEINCLFGGWGKSTGRAWYDDVVLEPITDLSDQAEAIITIDTDAPSVPYSPMLFGGFIEHFQHQIYGGLFQPGSPLSDENGFRKDVIEAMRELKLSIVRWPGGCFASGYHWKDGVGTTRKTVADPVWGVEDPNTFGTDEFVEWCRLVGCEPYICTNAGNGTPEEMRDWVEYCNGTQGRYAQMRMNSGHARPLNVRYWSIGNENWGSHEIGRKSPQQWGPLVRKSAELMLTADPKLVLFAAATPNRDWTLPLLATAGEHLDYVAIHQYWLPCWRRELRPDYVSCIMLSEGPEQTISRVIDVIEESGYIGRIKIAFDEWNLRGWHHPGFPRKQASDTSDPAVRELIGKRDINADASQYSMADALFSASFLNACLRHAEDVGMANIAPIVNTRGPLYVHPNGIVRRTTFHTLAMYANDLEGRVGRLNLEAGMLVQGKRFIPVIDAVATVDELGETWAIALVNRHPAEHVACTVKLKDALLEGTYEARILAGDSPDAYNDVERPNRVVPERKQLTFKQGVVRLPPHSLTIVRIVISGNKENHQ